LRITPNVYD